MRARLADVAKLAKVHPATASRALNERTRSLVSQETLERVTAAAQELNYLPDTAARSLASAKSSTIGVVVGDLAVPLFAPMIRGIDDVAWAAGYSTLVVDTDNDRKRELTHLRNLHAQRVDGLIVTTSTVGDPDGSDRFTNVAPTVSLLRFAGGSLGPEVGSNDDQGMRQIIDHLVEHGHSRIALVAGPPRVSTSLARLRGYRNAMCDHGLDPDPSLIATIDHIDPDRGREAARQLVHDTDCTAIVGFNDLVTFGVLKELRALGVRCPDDISVVGYSDVPTADLVVPPLTTISVDHYAMGAEAARLLLDIITGVSDGAAKAIQLPVKLVERESVGPAKSREPLR